MTTATVTGRTEAPASTILFRTAIASSLSSLGQFDYDVEDVEFELGGDEGGKQLVQERFDNVHLPRILCGGILTRKQPNSIRCVKDRPQRKRDSRTLTRVR